MAISTLFFTVVFMILASYNGSIQCLAINADAPDEGLTVQFTAYYPPQIPPTSTVYDTMVTKILKVKSTYEGELDVFLIE